MGHRCARAVIECDVRDGVVAGGRRAWCTDGPDQGAPGRGTAGVIVGTGVGVGRVHSWVTGEVGDEASNGASSHPTEMLNPLGGIVTRCPSIPHANGARATKSRRRLPRVCTMPSSQTAPEIRPVSRAFTMPRPTADTSM